MLISLHFLLLMLFSRYSHVHPCSLRLKITYLFCLAKQMGKKSKELTVFDS